MTSFKFKDTPLYHIMICNSKYHNVAKKLSEVKIQSDKYNRVYKEEWPGRQDSNVTGWYELSNGICIGECRMSKKIFLYKHPKYKQLTEIMSEIENYPEYKALTKWEDQNVFESYCLMGELLNPSYAYKYTQERKGKWNFTTRDDIKYTCVLVLNPMNTGNELEFKFGWVDSNKKIHYSKGDQLNNIDEFRSNTIAKIWRDEILPIFKKQDRTNLLVMYPLVQDIKRYLFALKMVQKFKEDWFDIDETSKPKILKLIKK